jgi:integrating conjugative element protein (TIGR03761 family)
MTTSESPAETAQPAEITPVDATPGALRGEAWLTLHTRHAQVLFMGRAPTEAKHYIIGVTKFGQLLSQLLVCVQADDPYADWWLVKVENALDESAQEIAHLRHQIEQALRATPAIDITLAVSLRPVRVPLQFRNPYAYRAARMLADFDTLARGVLTLRHVGLLDYDESHRHLLLGARSFRRALGTAHGYRYTGVNRADIEENTAKAQQARERLGQLPPEILTGTVRARHVPKRTQTTVATPSPRMLSGWARYASPPAQSESTSD